MTNSNSIVHNPIAILIDTNCSKLPCTEDALIMIILPVGVVSVGEECDLQSIPSHYDAHNPEAGRLDDHGSPNKKKKTVLSGQKQIDHIIHTMIDYILRDYIDSWFGTLTENKEFSELRTRNCAEESIQNICNR